MESLVMREERYAREPHGAWHLVTSSLLNLSDILSFLNLFEHLFGHLFWSCSLSNGVDGSISATSSDSYLKVSFLVSVFLVFEEESGQVSWQFVRRSPSFFCFNFFIFFYYVFKRMFDLHNSVDSTLVLPTNCTTKIKKERWLFVHFKRSKHTIFRVKWQGLGYLGNSKQSNLRNFRVQ